jgi:hypothetical protein
VFATLDLHLLCISGLKKRKIYEWFHMSAVLANNKIFSWNLAWLFWFLDEIAIIPKYHYTKSVFYQIGFIPNRFIPNHVIPNHVLLIYTNSRYTKSRYTKSLSTKKRGTNRKSQKIVIITLTPERGIGSEPWFFIAFYNLWSLHRTWKCTYKGTYWKNLRT